MLVKLKAHIESHHLFNTQDRLLLGVSAGVDSIVLAHLLKELSFDFFIAHMNFGLRGQVSDLDADFVEQWGRSHGIITHILKVDTEAHAKKIKHRFKWLPDHCVMIGFLSSLLCINVRLY